MHMQVKNGDAIALDADFMPMGVEARAPGGGVECPAPDADGDGLSDALEAKLGTNPGVPDTDRDRLTDGQEHFKYKTNPRKSDTDKDGLKDGLEVKKYRTKPLKPDTDGDHLKDGVEVDEVPDQPAQEGHRRRRRRRQRGDQARHEPASQVGLAGAGILVDQVEALHRLIEVRRRPGA